MIPHHTIPITRHTVATLDDCFPRMIVQWSRRMGGGTGEWLTVGRVITRYQVRRLSAFYSPLPIATYGARHL